MMAAAGPPSSAGFLPLLECLEDGAAEQSEQTDAYLTIANRLSGEEGRQFLPAVEKHFSRLGKAALTHMSSPSGELSQAALQALGFCVYHGHVVSGAPESLAAGILTALCSLVGKATDKNTCTRALWVISKQSFPPDVVAKKVPSILDTLDGVWSREDVQSVVMEHEALNVVIRMLEQVPSQMADGVVQWAKLVVPLVVHSASKVRLRAAAAMEMGMPLLLQKQTEVAAVIEPMMSSKLVPELQKLFMSKNETNVLKLWPLFVKLLGKLLHRGGPFINSLLHLEELGFRSSSPTIKKIAFIAWKSLIDNFALNPDILCSSKRMKLLMQPLASIHVRTEALLLTKVEVWWYLVVQLGSNLSPNFDQVAAPLLQCTIGSDASSVPGTPSRAVSQNGAVVPGTPKTGTPGFNGSANSSRMSLNSSVHVPTTFPSIQLLGLEMLLHFLLGSDVTATAAKNKLVLSLEPLNHPLLSSASTFTKHAAVLTSHTRDGFINIGRDAPAPLLAAIWTNLVRFVNVTVESGSKKERQGCEVLTLMLQALQSIVASEAVPADKVLILFEATVNGVPQRVLGSASYQVGKMDVLNGTPALFLILLLYNSSMLAAYVEDDRFFHCLQTLVACGLSGPTSPLAFGEAVLGAIRGSTGSLQNKEQLWRMWSVVVSPLTDTITQSNEVNQGDALEHNFSAVHSALLFPITHLLHGGALHPVSQRAMLCTWSKLYKVFARCSALVVTAEENICCEELCAKMEAATDRDALMVPSTLHAVASILQVMVECVDFSPYTPQFQQKLKSPHTPVNWMKKRSKVLGNLSTFQSLLVQCLDVYLEGPGDSSDATGLALVSVLSVLFTNLVLANTVKEALTTLIQPLALLYKQAASESPRFTAQLLAKLEKLLGEVLGCLQARSTLAYNSELLALLSPLLSVLFPHKNKQLRTSVTQFWNSTFANSVSLTYPDDIRPILSQVKQKTPIIVPGFELVGAPDELSGQYSSESSQLETKLSGMPVSSVVKRDSLPGKAAELKDRSATKLSKPVSTKLDFGSPKLPRREALEEEASIDFVFIPPETKERVLTEHQKEVKRTKRVDIPAMYNNLDASLDTTVFTQYTQSQEDSLDKLPTAQADDVTDVAPGEVAPEEVENGDDTEVLKKETQDYVSPQTENMTENHEQEEMVPESADVSVVDDAKTDDAAQEGTSPNFSSESVSGTPQKPSSRRQSFITLEKYAEGKPASPSGGATFTGPLMKTSSSREGCNTKNTSSLQASQTSAGPNSQDSQLTDNMHQQSPLRPKDSTKSKPLRLTDRLPSDTTEDEDVIPDTQTEVKTKEGTKVASASEEMQPSSQEEESEPPLDDSQSSMTSPGEPRRSGRYRVKPLLPGEEPEEQDRNCTPFKRRRSGEEPESDSSKVQNRPNTRRKQAAEEDGGREGLRTRAQKDKSESSQTNSQGRPSKKVKLHSKSEDFLGDPEPRRRSTRGSSQTDSQSDHESQSQVKHGRRSKSSETKEDGRMKKKALRDKESSQVATHETGPVEQAEKQDEPKTNSQMITSPPKDGQAQEFEQTGKNDENLKDISQIVPSSPEVSSQTQEFGLTVKTKQEGRDSETAAAAAAAAAAPTNEESRDEKSTASVSGNESEVRDKLTTREVVEDDVHQEDSQVITPSSSDSQSLRRSRRSKASPEAAESDGKSGNKESSGRQSRSNSQALLEAPIVGRTRRSKVHESSPSSTPESSQSLDNAEASQGRGRLSRRRSSQALAANVETSGSESSETRDHLPMARKRGRKPRASLPSPLSQEPKDVKLNDTAQSESDSSQQVDGRSLDAAADTNTTDSLKTQELNVNVENQCNEESPVQQEAAERTEAAAVERSCSLSVSPGKQEQEHTSTNTDHPSSLESDPGDLPCADGPNSAGISAEQAEEAPSDPLASSAVDTLPPPAEPTEELQDSCEEMAEAVAEPAEAVAEPAEAVAEPADYFPEEQKNDSTHLEDPVIPVEDGAEDGRCPSEDRPDVPEDASPLEDQSASIREVNSANQHPEASAGDDGTPAQESDPDGKAPSAECPEEEEEDGAPAAATEDAAAAAGLDAALTDGTEALQTPELSKDVLHGSPVKQKDLEAVMGLDVGQSPSSGRTRGTWSPSASPSTSILKKGQKRPLEDESPSPLVKSRRVSFANPIQQQETADDIDRRSPAVRTSSPRRSKVSSIPQPKYITTPTKGLLILSPRNLHSPGYKSSKKCLISEMSQEARPVSRDCIYPALVGCSAPVEAVLPQISSNMWSRGFGQLVRARNIKTVGDLSALTPSEIKTLPIRSPKISNVKKALKVYEQQRKGRGGDELKSFDEVEMASELEETSVPQEEEEEEEEEKASGETLATELVDEAAPAAGGGPEQDGGPAAAAGLLTEVEALACNMTPLQLGWCSPQQLGQMHDALGGLMRRLVVELQTRLTDAKP